MSSTYLQVALKSFIINPFVLSLDTAQIDLCPAYNNPDLALSSVPALSIAECMRWANQAAAFSTHSTVKHIYIKKYIPVSRFLKSYHIGVRIPA